MSDAKGTPLKWVNLALGLVLAIIVAGGLLILAVEKIIPRQEADAPRQQEPPPTFRVAYRVTGSVVGAFVTYANYQGNTEQQEVELYHSRDQTFTPWVYEIVFPRPPYGVFFYVSAQSQGTPRRASELTWWVGCEILVNGKPWREAHSTGEASIASCSGRFGE